MSTHQCRWILNTTIVLSFLIPLISYSQVTIKEKVEIKPDSGFRINKIASGSELRVVSEFGGPVDPNYPALVYVKGPCGINSSVGGASGTLTVAAYEGVYTVGYRFTSPKGGGGPFHFAVYLGNIALFDSHDAASCPYGCTMFSQMDIPLYRGFAFSPAYDVIGLASDNYFTASIDAANTPCAQASWSPWMDIELEITKGRDIGQFLGRNGEPVGTKTTMRVNDPWYTPIFVADGTKPYGDVEVTARSGDLSIVRTFEVRVRAPWVVIEPPWISYWPITIDFAHLPVLEFGDMHYPYPGEPYEPTISWDPDSSINTADYINTFSDTLHFYVKVKAENPGGVAQDSSLVTLVKACIKVSFDPPTLSPGDTAGLSFQRVLPDGSVEDLAGGSYLFSATILGGEDSSKGLLLGDYGVATTLLDESSIRYVAPKTIQGSKLEVQVSGSAIESGGGATSIGVPGKPSLVAERINATLAKKGVKKSAILKSVAVKNKPGPAQLANAMRKVAALSSSCPINKVVIQKPTLKILDHAPWSIWPSLPPQHRNGDSRGAERPGYNAKRSFRISVLDPYQQPMKDVKVKIFTQFEQGSGGHGHVHGVKDLREEKRGVFWSKGDHGNSMHLRSDENGIIQVDSMVGLQVSGKLLITAMIESDTTARDTVNLIVSVPGLVEFERGEYWSLTGTVSPEGQNHMSNHWCTQVMKDNLMKALKTFYEWTGSDEGGGAAVTLAINDMSLRWGGVFDIFGQWDLDNEHSFHRIGVSVDINNNGLKKQDPDFPDDDEKKILTTRGRNLVRIMASFGGKIYAETPIHFGFDKGN